MSRFLLDTTVLSDIAKRNPKPIALIEWVEQNLSSCFISALSLHELEFGSAHLSFNKSLADKLRAVRCQQLNAELIKFFSGHIVRVDEHLLVRSAWLRARAERVHKDIGLSDAIIAAAAETIGAYIVTGNVNDFSATGLTVFNSATLELVKPPTLSAVLQPDAFKKMSRTAQLR